MPSPTDMLFAYQSLIRQSTGHGMAYLNRQAQYGKTVRALLEVVNGDYDQRVGDKPCP